MTTELLTFRFSEETRVRLLKDLPVERADAVGLLERRVKDALLLGLVEWASSELQARRYRAAVKAVRRARLRGLRLLRLIESELARKDTELSLPPECRSRLEQLQRLLAPELVIGGRRRRRKPESIRLAVEHATLQTIEDLGVNTGGDRAARILAVVLRAISVPLSDDPDTEHTVLMRARKRPVRA